MRPSLVAALCVVACALSPEAQAQKDSAFAVLLPGAGGAVPQDFLMRNRAAFTTAGIETSVATSAAQAVSQARAEQKKGRRVVLVGMSRGGLYLANALASGAPAVGAVFVSANYRNITAVLGAPLALPSTLVVHHRNDACKFTLPSAVDPFIRWSGGKASVRWIDTRGQSASSVCGPLGAHGFYRQDGPAVSAIISFVRSK
jgi:hypothetical protein